MQIEKQIQMPWYLANRMYFFIIMLIFLIFLVAVLFMSIGPTLFSQNYPDDLISET